MHAVICSNQKPVGINEAQRMSMCTLGDHGHDPRHVFARPSPASILDYPAEDFEALEAVAHLAAQSYPQLAVSGSATGDRCWSSVQWGTAAEVDIDVQRLPCLHTSRKPWSGPARWRTMR